MDPYSQLSLDQLAQVLSHVDIKPRLSSCSLVSTTWRTAAARATTSIKVDNRTLAARAPLASFEEWLWAHTAQVHVGSLRMFYADRDADVVELPVAQLQHLEDLELQRIRWSPGAEPAGADIQVDASSISGSRSSSGSSLQPLTALTALTRLALGGDSVRLAGLSALTGLQELFCEVVQFSSSMPAITAAEADLVAAFPQLQRLTSLTLHGDITSTAVVSQLSTLQSLQRLERRLITARSFAALPESLTQLRLSFGPAGSLTASTAAGLSQLTALQVLYLFNVRPLDLSLLAGMRNLRSVRLQRVEFAARGHSLQVFSSFTGLKRLNIADRNHWWWGGGTLQLQPSQQQRQVR